MLRDAGWIFGTRKWMPEEGGGNLDIETRCMQEGVQRNGGICRYWSQVPAENGWERGGWERGKLDIETRMNARSCWDEKRKPRYIEPKWRCMHEAVERQGEAEILKPHECGKLWGGTDGGDFRRPGHGGTRYKTKWMQEVAPGHREYWSKMNAGSCCGAPGRKLRYLKQNERKKLWGGCGGSIDIETQWMQEV